MVITSPTPTLVIARRTIRSRLVSVAAVCFTGAFLTDVAYALTSNIDWANFSAWLLAIGAVFGALAVVAALASLVSGRVARARLPAWEVLAGEAVVLVLAVFDNLIHSRDAWTSVMPVGLVLSAVIAAVMATTAILSVLPARSPAANTQIAGAQR